MNKSSKETTFPIHVGASSILVIFVILCLVAFATLSIISANADAKLSEKVAERSSAYYEAQNQANLCLAQLDAALTDAYEQSLDEEDYFRITGRQTSYQFPITDVQSLSVNVDILYPKEDGDTFYQITSWQIITTTEMEYNNNFIVIP